MKATAEFLNELEILSETRMGEILSAPDTLEIKGKIYYVSAMGDDENDGLSPEKAWKTLDRVSASELCEGDGVLFRRGDIFRGRVITRSGVSYGAYGEGEKPKLYGWDKSLCDPSLWELYDENKNIWKLNEPMASQMRLP